MILPSELNILAGADSVAIPGPWKKSLPFACEKAAKYLRKAADKNMPEVRLHAREFLTLLEKFNIFVLHFGEILQ